MKNHALRQEWLQEVRPGFASVRVRLVFVTMITLMAVAGARGAQITLSWTDNATNESGFKVERATGTGGYVQIATLAANVTSYADASATTGVSYTYRIRAYNAVGDSPYSNNARSGGSVGGSSGPPAITSIANQATGTGGQVGPVSFSVGDYVAQAGGLVVTATSSNQTLVPNSSIVLGGSGATRTISLSAATGQSGVATITVTVTNGVSSRTESFLAAFGAALPATSRLVTVSTRLLCRSDVDTLIPGFVISGPVNKRVLMRVMGPTLSGSPFNVSNVLPNPRMTLKRWNGAAFVDHASNDDWGTNANVAGIREASSAVSAFPLTEGGRDAALLLDLPPGRYTIIADDATAPDGMVVVEMYDADATANGSTFVNMSNRGYVGTGTQVAVTGFIISPEAAKTLLIRAVGPGLAGAPLGVPNTIADPVFDVYRRNTDGTDTLVLSNDNWGDGPDALQTTLVAAQVGAFPLPGGSRDAAAVVTLSPGLYSVVVRGLNDVMGTALVEFYTVE